MFSPSAGSVISIVITSYAMRGFAFSGSIFKSRIAWRIIARLYLLLSIKLYERRQHDESRIHFEEVSQSFATVAATKSICSKTVNVSREPTGDGIRQSPDIVRRRYENSWHIGQTLADVWDAGLLLGVEQVPALRVNAVMVKFLIAGNAPNIRGNIVFFIQ